VVTATPRSLYPRERPGTYRRRGGRSGRVRKISPPPGFDPRTVQPVASHYTDWAIPAHMYFICTIHFSECYSLRDNYTAASKRPRSFTLCLRIPFLNLYSAVWTGTVFRTHMMMITEVFLDIHLLRCSNTFMFVVQKTKKKKTHSKWKTLFIIQRFSTVNARLLNRPICRHSTDWVHIDEHRKKTMSVVLAKHRTAPWWWFLREPKHVGASVITFKLF
jgi:hypothetical protein